MICRLCSLLNSSIGKKIQVALAGLLLCGFLVTHLAGNLLLFVGEATFNRYAETLEHNPLLIPAEIVLGGLFLIHIVLALKLKLENRAARPVAYLDAQSKGGRTAGSSTMAVTGTLVLAFLIVHIKTLKFGDDPKGLYDLVLRMFGNPLYSGFYVVAMGGLMLHLSHGFQSAFQTFGVNHPRYTPLIKRVGAIFAFVIAGGFAFIPIWAYVIGGDR